MAGDSDGEGAFGKVLAADVVEGGGRNRGFGNFDMGWWGEGELVFEMEDDIVEGGVANEGNVGNKGGLGEVGLGEIDGVEAGGAGGLHNINDAADGAEGAGEGKFADEGDVVEIGLSELVGEYENGEGDGEVKEGTVFGELGGRKIDG